MLSMSPMSGDQAGYYLGLAREDYYLEGGEPPGRWFGNGARALELVGVVRPDDLYNLFDGLSPDGSASLVQQQGKNHRPGWDLTFSAPKSVSVLWSQASPEVRLQIQEAQHKAVAAALEFLEGTALYTRRGREGHEMEPVGMVAALFEHSTSRALDPQLHTHALLMNVAVRDDGTTGTVSSFHVFLSKMVAGALYRVELAYQLENRLGLTIERKRSWFEVAGVSQKLIDFFSKRREAITEEIQRKGLNTAQAAAVAAIETRESKEAISRPRLFDAWRVDGADIGWSTDDADKLVKPGRRPVRNLDEERENAIARATERISSSSAHFTYRDFTRAVAEEAQGRGLSAVDVIESSAMHLSNSKEIVALGQFEGEQRFTTQKMFDLERQLLDDSINLHLEEKHKVSVERVATVIARHPELSEEQMKATWHLAHTSGGIAIVSGMAGTGKTHMLATAKEAWESEGLNVIGVSLAARAAKQLQEGAGIPSQTLAKLFYQLGIVVYKDPEPEEFKSFEKNYGPDVLEPIRGLLKSFGPDILEPVRRILDKHGPNILEPLATLAEKFGPNVLEPFESLAEKYSPDIRQAWTAIAKHVTSKVEEIRKPVLTEKTVVVLDEAGMVATPEMAILADACNKAGAKLVLIGDERQLQPIGPGAPFAQLGEEFGKAVLTDIRRQNEKWERQAVKDMAAGEAREAIREYAERGLVSVMETRAEAMQALVAQWQSDHAPLRDTLILAGTKKDVQQLNQLAQKERLAAGELGKKSVEHDGGRIYEGDQVMFTKTSKPRGVENGGRAHVLSVDAGSKALTVILDSGDKTTLSLETFKHVSLGYATTTHKAQGATVENAYILVGGKMQDREMSYVQASRAKESTRFYTTRVEAGDELAALAREMERSHQKQMAHTVMEQVPRMRM